MDISFTIPGFDQIPLVFRTGGLFSFSGGRILCGGTPLKRIKGRQFVLPLADGTTLTMGLKNQGMDFMIPNVIYNGQIVQLAPPLPIYQSIMAYCPFFLVMIGGAIGGFCGGLGAYFNLHIFHGPFPLPAKVALWLLVTMGSALVWLIVAGLLSLLLNH